VRRRRIQVVLLALLCLLCIALRIAWEHIAPLHFRNVKSAIYVRDALTLTPAALFGTAAVLRMPPVSLRSLDALLRRHRLAITCMSAVTFAASALIARFGLRGGPAVVDEAAYRWQADLFAHGHLTASPHAFSPAMLVEYVGAYHGRVISAFFPGSSLPLTLGQMIGVPWIVDPLLAAFVVALTYWAGRRLFDDRVSGAVAAVGLGTSPFLLFQGASYFSHVWTALFVVPAFVLGLTARTRRQFVASGALLAATLFSRPVSTIIAVATLVLVWAVTERSRKTLSRTGFVALGALPLVALFAAYDRVTTGRWLQTPHRVLLPDETLQLNVHAVKNAFINIAGLAVDFSGLVVVGLALFVVGVWRGGRIERAIAVLGVLQLCVYSLYYNNGVSYGPRYLFEVTPLLVLVAARGATSIAALRNRLVPLAVVAVVITAVAIVPTRLAVFHPRATYLDMGPTLHQLQKAGPALVFVEPGPSPFPDSYWAAFVHNGAQPESRQVMFVRDSPDRCAVVAANRDRHAYTLDLDGPRWGGMPALKPLVETCFRR
jgi:hypothetical protein